MDKVIKSKMERWLKPEFIEEFEEYMKNKTVPEDGFYYMNFETFLWRKKYLKGLK